MCPPADRPCTRVLEAGRLLAGGGIYQGVAASAVAQAAAEGSSFDA